MIFESSSISPRNQGLPQGDEKQWKASGVLGQILISSCLVRLFWSFPHQFCFLSTKLYTTSSITSHQAFRKLLVHCCFIIDVHPILHFYPSPTLYSFRMVSPSHDCLTMLQCNKGFLWRRNAASDWLLLVAGEGVGAGNWKCWCPPVPCYPVTNFIGQNVRPAKIAQSEMIPFSNFEYVQYCRSVTFDTVVFKMKFNTSIFRMTLY